MKPRHRAIWSGFFIARGKPMSVAELGRKGLTAANYTATARLHEELNAALDRAQEAGVPVEMVVGMLECTKGAVLESYFRDMEEIHAE